MKILIIGADGQLGSDLVNELKSNHQVTALTNRDIEVTDLVSVSKAFKRYKPTLVINTAAFHNVPACEKKDKKAFNVNALGVKFIAQNCVAYDSTLMHISTDYVFDGKKNKPYKEADVPNPLNVYGISKLMGEFYVKSILDKYYIVRTSGLYGVHKCIGKGINFIEAVLKLSKKQKQLKVISDEILTPTYTLDLARQIRVMIGKTKKYGI